MAPKRKCAGTNKTGNPCRSTGILDNGYCMAHQPQEVRETRGFGGSQPGAGRPKNPRAVDVLREKIEADIDGWLDVLLEARSADRGVVVGNGPQAYVDYVPDHPTRIAAFREAFSRVYGTPKQTTELTGPDGAPVVTALVTDERLAEDARALLRRAAAPRSD